MVETWATCRRVGSQFLFRIPRNITAHAIAKLPDGSRRVRLNVREPKRGGHIQSSLEIREIRVQVGRNGFRRHQMRLGTSLLDPRTAPALELAQLSMRRAGSTNCISAKRNACCARRTCCRATPSRPARRNRGDYAGHRAAGAGTRAGGQRPGPRLARQFGVVLAVVRSMWFVLGPLEDLLTARQKDHVVARGEALMRRCVTAKCRSRTNPRAVRQPIRGWPRLQQTNSVEGPLQFKVV